MLDPLDHLPSHAGPRRKFVSINQLAKTVHLVSRCSLERLDSYIDQRSRDLYG